MMMLGRQMIRCEWVACRGLLLEWRALDDREEGVLGGEAGAGQGFVKLGR